jgi:hypothetical protein
VTNLDIAGLLMTYSHKVRNTTDKEKLKELIRDLKSELDLRKVKGGE